MNKYFITSIAFSLAFSILQSCSSFNDFQSLNLSQNINKSKFSKISINFSTQQFNIKSSTTPSEKTISTKISVLDNNGNSLNTKVIEKKTQASSVKLALSLPSNYFSKIEIEVKNSNGESYLQGVGIFKPTNGASYKLQMNTVGTKKINNTVVESTLDLEDTRAEGIVDPNVEVVDYTNINNTSTADIDKETTIQSNPSTTSIPDIQNTTNTTLVLNIWNRLSGNSLSEENLIVKISENGLISSFKSNLNPKTIEFINEKQVIFTDHNSNSLFMAEVNSNEKLIKNIKKLFDLEFDNKKLFPKDIDILSNNEIILNSNNLNTSSETLSAYLVNLDTQKTTILNDDFKNLTEIEPNPLNTENILVRMERGLDDYWINILDKKTKTFKELIKYQSSERKYNSHWFSDNEVAFLHNYSIGNRGKDPIFTTGFKVIDIFNLKEREVFRSEDINKLNTNKTASILDFFVDKNKNIYILVDKVDILNNTIHSVVLMKYKNGTGTFSEILQIPTSNFERASISASFN